MITRRHNAHASTTLDTFLKRMLLWGGFVLLFLGVLGVKPSPLYAQADPDSGSQNRKYEFRRQEVFKYSNRGRRDPFKPLVSESTGEVQTDLLNVEEATLTGIIWMGDHMVALFKDKKGKSYYMKKGDAVYNGRIIDIKDNSVIVSVFQFGATRRLELRVTEHSNDDSGG